MRGLQTIITLVIALLLGGISSHVHSADSVYPGGYNIGIRYELSDTVLSLGKILVVTRTVVNNETISLTSLHLSDNLPPELMPTEQEVTLNGVPIGYHFFDTIMDEIITGYKSYYWLLDEPGNPPDTLYPNDSLAVRLHIVCNQTGTFTLPFHTTVFRGESIGMFAYGDSLSIRVGISVDVSEPPGDHHSLPGSFLMSSGYPNPFNSIVTIYYSGKNPAGDTLLLQVYNVLGQIIHRRSFRSRNEQGQIVWKPSVEVGSGVYFYSLTTGNSACEGKLVLIK